MPTPPTWPAQAVGQPARGSFINGNIEAALTFFAHPPQARVYRTAALSGLVSGTWYLPQWDTNDYDTDGMHTSSNILTVQTAGYYQLDGLSILIAGAGNTDFMLRKNAAGSTVGGSQLVFMSMDSAYNPLPSLTRPFNQGDTIEGFIRQSSGSNQNLVVGIDGSYLSARLVSLL